MRVAASDSRPETLEDSGQDSGPNREDIALQARRLRAAVDVGRDALILLDNELRILYVSANHAEMIGFSTEDAIGAPAAAMPVHPDDLPVVYEGLQLALRQPGVEVGRELRLRDDVGVYFWVEALACNHLNDPDVRAIVVHLRDIRDRKAVEEALRTSEERAWQFFEAVPIGIAIARFDGSPPRINHAFREMLGYASDETIAHFLEAIHPDEKTEAAKWFEELRQGERDHYDVERRYIHRDGHVVYADVSVVAVEDKVGKQRVVLITAQDITDRKRSERALAESEKRFRTIFELAPIGIEVYNWRGDYMQVNEAFEQMTGYTDDEVRGRNAAEFVHENDMHDGARLFTALSHAMTNYYQRKKRYVRKDGCDVHARVSVKGVYDDNGALEYAIGMSEDLTHRVEAEEALRESQRRSETIFESVPIGMALFDASGSLIATNQAYQRMFECDSHEIKRFNVIDRTHPDDRAESLQRFENLQAGHSDGYTLDKRYIRNDGSTMWASITVTAVRGPSDELLYVIDTVEDITPRKLAETRLEEMNADLEQRVRERTVELESAVGELKRMNDELQQFVYVASHDLKEPARTVTNYVQLLQRRFGDLLDASASDFVEFAADAARRMQAQIEGLLAFSRVATRGEPFAPTDANAVVRAALRLLRKPIEETKADIALDCLPTIVADERQIEQLFVNLLDNALKFRSEAPPRVRIAVRDDGEFWRFEVADNGIGISPERVDRVFVMFQRLHTLEEYPGIGAGLAVSKRIVERHGGRIGVESVPGHGSTFVFTLAKRPKPASEDR